MNKAASLKYSLKYIWDIQQKQVLGRLAYSHSCSSCPSELCETHAGVEQDAEIQNAPKCNSLIPGCCLHAAPVPAVTAARTCRREPGDAAEGNYSLVTHTQRGNWSRSKVGMNSRQASPGYPTTLPGTSG